MFITKVDDYKIHDYGLGQFVEWFLIGKENQPINEFLLQERFYWDTYQLLEKENRADIKFLDCYLDYSYDKVSLSDLKKLLEEIKSIAVKSDKKLYKSIKLILEHIKNPEIERIVISGI